MITVNLLSVGIKVLITQEIIPRELNWGAQTGMAIETAWYVAPGGRLLLSDLLIAFSQFFREHSGSWLEIAQL